MESTRDRLRRAPLFRQLDDAALDQLAGLSRIVHLQPKEMLYREGEPYRGMFVVLDGLAVVYRMSAEGRMLIVHVCRPGDSLAEAALFEEQDAGYPAHARATRESEILFLPKAPFVAFLQERPEVAWAMLQDFAAKMKEMTLRLEGITLREVRSRVARYLMREVEASGLADGETPELTLPLAKGSVASYLGTAHETLSRTFTRMIKEKIIAVEGRKVTILDRKKLERMV